MKSLPEIRGKKIRQLKEYPVNARPEVQDAAPGGGGVNRKEA